MFNAKQKKLLTTLGYVSDKERTEIYEAYCEVSCEMRANGMKAGSFTVWLEHKIRIAEYIAQRNAEKSLKQMA
jgi:hypothetical protein